MINFYFQKDYTLLWLKKRIMDGFEQQFYNYLKQFVDSKAQIHELGEQEYNRRVGNWKYIYKDKSMQYNKILIKLEENMRNKVGSRASGQYLVKDFLQNGKQFIMVFIKMIRAFLGEMLFISNNSGYLYKGWIIQ